VNNTHIVKTTPWHNTYGIPISNEQWTYHVAGVGVWIDTEQQTEREGWSEDTEVGASVCRVVPSSPLPLLTHSDARELYGNWQALKTPFLSCQTDGWERGSPSHTHSFTHFLVQWRDKSLLTCQSYSSCKLCCYQCIIYRASGAADISTELGDKLTGD
jgi:hypothetical protein